MAKKRKSKSHKRTGRKSEHESEHRTAHKTEHKTEHKNETHKTDSHKTAHKKADDEKRHDGKKKSDADNRQKQKTYQDVFEKPLMTYAIDTQKVKAEVSIQRLPNELVPIYLLKIPDIKPATIALMEQLGERLLVETPVKISDLTDPKSLEDLKEKFYERSLNMLRRELEKTSDTVLEFLAGSLVNEMLGLGKIEILLSDKYLEEIVVNNAKEPVWVFHKKHGWLKSNVLLGDETQIRNYSSVIGRKVGRQITTLDPLMDAHLVSGDRVNATLFPISTKGNTITIRKFRRNPWAVTELAENKTIEIEIVALLWTMIQYEMNVIVSGGTGSGKTTFLNVLMPFIPINHRIISIEDTREIVLPNFLHWVPMTTREPNAEGKGEVSMLNLLVNSLRMRPDRIIVGEIRRGDQAEVLFESMHTGHSVYATLHADTAEQTYRRLIHPPISVPEPLLEALDLIVVMFRDRRRGIRRVYEIAEIVSASDMQRTFVKKDTAFGTLDTQRMGGVRVLYKWDAQTDKILKHNDSVKMINKLKEFTGMTDEEIERDHADKKKILQWLVKNQVKTVDAVGKVVAEYYQDPKRVLKIVEDPKSTATSLVPAAYLEYRDE